MNAISLALDGALDSAMGEAGFADLPLLQETIAAYEAAFIDFLGPALTAQLYPTIYKDSYPDIRTEGAFPSVRAEVALSGEAKCAYTPTGAWMAPAAHFRQPSLRWLKAKRVSSAGSVAPKLPDPPARRQGFLLPRTWCRGPKTTAVGVERGEVRPPCGPSPIYPRSRGYIESGGDNSGLNPALDLVDQSLQLEGIVEWAVLFIQAYTRMYAHRRSYIMTRDATIKIQAASRSHWARETYFERRCEAAKERHVVLEQTQMGFAKQLAQIGRERREASFQYDDFVLASNKSREQVTSHFMPVCFEKIERIFFDTAETTLTRGLRLRVRGQTVPIILVSPPSPLEESTADLLSTYVAPAASLSHCMLSLLYFLFDATVAHVIVVAQTETSSAYLRQVLQSLSQCSVLRKRNWWFRKNQLSFRPDGGTISTYTPSPLRSIKGDMSVTPGPQEDHSISPQRPGRAKQAHSMAAPGIVLPDDLSGLLSTKLTIIVPRLLQSLTLAGGNKETYTFTGSTGLVLSADKDSLRLFRAEVDRIRIQYRRLVPQGELFPYFVSIGRPVSDFEISVLMGVTKIPFLQPLESAREQVREYILGVLSETGFFNVRPISALRRYIDNTDSLDPGRLYYAAPFADNEPNLFSEASTPGLAGMHAYAIGYGQRGGNRTRVARAFAHAPNPSVNASRQSVTDSGASEFRPRRPITVVPILPVSNLDRPSPDIAANICSGLSNVGHRLLSIDRELAERAFVVVRLAVYVEQTWQPTVTYLASGIDVSSSIKGTGLPTRSFGTLMPAPLTIYQHAKQASTEPLAHLIRLGVFGLITLHFLYCDAAPISRSVLDATFDARDETPAPMSVSLSPSYQREPKVSDLSSTSSASTCLLVNVSYGLNTFINHFYACIAYGDLSWNSSRGELTRLHAPGAPEPGTDAQPISLISLPLLWHRDLSTLDRRAYMNALMREEISFDSATRTGMLFDWSGTGNGFGVYGIYPSPYAAVQHAERLLAITLSAVHTSCPNSVTAAHTRVTSLDCESEANGRAYARLRTEKLASSLPDCRRTLHSMLPYLRGDGGLE
ncbi:hypothetical protein GMRT_10480 [Giardia muris]|uniref:Uncharacterized protein n=1 Tax=Giardia muris TaxID=5742 RepID=A0A4Z1T1U4_GIAMU|nr:hypothetical protein GMRT_10480 [Giardia muris]|eukprot:TNJ26529.1 hypothetical protein GMRT_10480 [Giardia muris]